MIPSLSGYCGGDAVANLETIYDGQLRRMPQLERLALMATLAEAAYLKLVGQSESLVVIALNRGYTFNSNPQAMQRILTMLDNELTSIGQTAALIQGIATYANVHG